MKRFVWIMLAGLMVATSACSSVPFLAQPTATPTKIPTATATARPTATPTPVPTATATAIPTPANASESFLKMFSTWKGVKSFRAKMTSTDAKGVATQMTMEFVTPDRFHILGAQFEAILIGTTFYMKSGNTWIKAALPKGVDFSIADVKQLEAQVKATTTTKFVGIEMLDGAPTMVYEYTMTIKGPPVVNTTSKVWVGVADQLPRKMESSSSTGTKTVVLYSDYNSDIKIEAPIK